MGLADGIGDLRSTLRARYGEKVADPRDRAGQRHAGRAAWDAGHPAPARWPALDSLPGLPDELISALETRAIWARFGF